LPFTYVGFQNINVQGSKDGVGEVTLDLTRKHFLVLYTLREHIKATEHATLDTNLIRRTGSRYFLASGVFIETESEAVRLMAGSSNTDDKFKWDMIERINDFIDSPDYDQTFRAISIFGWSTSIIRHWKDR